jgi:hypothetical protein
MRRQADGTTTRRRVDNRLLAAGTVHATHSAKLAPTCAWAATRTADRGLVGLNIVGVPITSSVAG